MNEILRPTLAADLSSRSYTQFRRMPWGIRSLEKNSEMLGLPAGTVVPQLVLVEHPELAAVRSAKGSGSFLVAPDYSIKSHSRGYRSKANSAGPNIAMTEIGGAVLQELTVLCRREWGGEFQGRYQSSSKRAAGSSNSKTTLAIGTHRRSPEGSILHCCCVEGTPLPGNFGYPVTRLLRRWEIIWLTGSA